MLPIMSKNIIRLIMYRTLKLINLIVAFDNDNW